MSYRKIYETGLIQYRIENLLRNFTLGLALYNSVNHHLFWISIFFSISVINQCHPIMYAYIQIHKSDGFKQYLTKKIKQIQTHHPQLKHSNENNLELETLSTTIDPQLTWHHMELKYIQLIGGNHEPNSN